MQPSNNTERLWAYYHQRKTNPDRAIRIRDRLIADNRKLAQAQAHKFARNSREPYEDLEQLALIGLQKAIERYDPNNGAAFSSFAVPYIKGEILHDLRDYRNGVRVNRRNSEIYSQVKRYHRDMLGLGRVMPIEDVARRMGYDADRWREIREEMEQPTLLELDAEIAQAAGAIEEDPIDLITNESSPVALDGVIGRLPSPLRECVLERFWCGADVAAIAQRLEATPEQVKHWLAEALELCQKELAGVTDRDYVAGH